LAFFAEVDSEHGRDVAFAARVHAVKQKYFRAAASGLTIRPGVLRLVAEARAASVGLAIATTASLESALAVIGHVPGLAEAFDAIATGDDVVAKKPAPDVYRVALARLERGAETCIAIEDAELGLRSALAAGVATIVTPSSYTRDENFTGAAAVLSDLGEPAAPAVSLAGPPPPRGYVDIAYLSALLRSG
jgi:HAD superfamily hydrolase (TIGR01509 family)